MLYLDDEKLRAVIQDAVHTAFIEALKTINSTKSLQNEKPDENALFTIREVRDKLKISRSTIYKLLKEGTIQFIKIGRRTLIPARELAKIVAVQQDGADYD